MSEAAKDVESAQGVANLAEEAKRYLAEITQIKTQVEEHFKAAETARKNADSEGLFAFNPENRIMRTL